MTGHFGFEGSCQCVFAEGPFYGAFQNMGDPANFGILEGIMMNFVVQRRGNDYTISVNGKTVQTHTQAIPITSIGLRPHRATFKLYEWSVTIDTDDCALPSVGGDTYTNTDGYCRGGPAWEAPHNGAGDLWDCSPTGGMDGVNADGALVIECQAACDADDLCGAFDIEAHSTTTGTRSECCLFREGHSGQGSTERHCYVRDDGAPANRPGYAGLQPPGWVGCYQDCATQSDGQNMNRVCDDNVRDVTSVDDCIAACGDDYKYFGLACPRPNAFECWCCNELDTTSQGGTGKIPDSECDGGEYTSGVNNNRQDHCSGFSGSHSLANGDGKVFHLGGHCRAAIYNTKLGLGAAAQEARVCEGSTLDIDCAGQGGGQINIRDASYGRQDGPDVCPHAATSDQTCHEVSSTTVVSGFCQGQESCSVSATNGVFGDPCGGTYKYLTVSYDCVAAAPQAAAANCIPETCHNDGHW